MDFSWSAEEEAFREEIRDFLKAELPAGWNDTLVLDKEDEAYIDIAKTFTRKLGAKGWFTAHWPEEYGGLNWPFWQHFIMNEEMATADAPIIGGNGPKISGSHHYSLRLGVAKGAVFARHRQGRDVVGAGL